MSKGERPKWPFVISFILLLLAAHRASDSKVAMPMTKRSLGLSEYVWHDVLEQWAVLLLQHAANYKFLLCISSGVLANRTN